MQPCWNSPSYYDTQRGAKVSPMDDKQQKGGGASQSSVGCFDSQFKRKQILW